MYEVALELETKNRLYCEQNNKSNYTIPDSKLPNNKNDLKSRNKIIERAKMGSNNNNTNIDIVIFNDGVLESFCMVSSTKNNVVVKCKNDVTVSVLAHAKARIGQFFRLICDCLPNRLSGANIKLMITDTDSLACSVTVPVMMIILLRPVHLPLPILLLLVQFPPQHQQIPVATLTRCFLLLLHQHTLQM